ncbi:hypothetical protein HKD37_03G007515 [Glycine soja]
MFREIRHSCEDPKLLAAQAKEQYDKVDIISNDFSAELPFRLKQPMVKAAIQVTDLPNDNTIVVEEHYNEIAC